MTSAGARPSGIWGRGTHAATSSSPYEAAGSLPASRPQARQGSPGGARLGCSWRDAGCIEGEAEGGRVAGVVAQRGGEVDRPSPAEHADGEVAQAGQSRRERCRCGPGRRPRRRSHRGVVQTGSRSSSGPGGGRRGRRAGLLGGEAGDPGVTGLPAQPRHRRAAIPHGEHPSRAPPRRYAPRRRPVGAEQAQPGGAVGGGAAGRARPGRAGRGRGRRGKVRCRRGLGRGLAYCLPSGPRAGPGRRLAAHRVAPHACPGFPAGAAVGREGCIDRPSRRKRAGPGRTVLWLTARILVIALAAYLLLPQLAGLEASG
jgi:hypothetical protein